MEKKKAIKKKSGLAPLLRNKVEQNGIRYHSLLKQLPVGVYRSTLKGQVLEANAALTAMLGYTESELRRLDVQQLYCRTTEREGFIKGMEKAPVNISEYRLRKKRGGSIWVRDYCRAVKGPNRKIAYFDGILVDITREKKAEAEVKKVLGKLQNSNAERQEMIQKLEGDSVTDDLTGLYNRRGFFTITKEYLNLAVRKKIPMFLLYVDMDDLKVTNDTFGHHVGDEALRQLAQILRTTFRNSDIKGRMGGDEFAVFPIDSTPEGVEAATTRLTQNITAFNESGPTPFKLSVSTGVSRFDPENPTKIEELLILADKRMYEHKAAKRR